jgi:AP-2 complex subunit alpha
MTVPSSQNTISPPAIPSIAPAPAASAITDLLGLDSLDVPSMPNPVLNQASSTKIKSWYNYLLIRPSGILYEDDQIQVGVKTEYQGAKGRLAIFLGNKSGTPYQNVQIGISRTSWLTPANEGSVSSIAPMAQVQHIVNLHCIALGSDGPGFTLAYTAGQTQVALPPMKAPVALHKFQEGMTLSAQDFVTRWRQLNGKELQAQIQVPAPMEDAAAMRETLQGMQMAVLDGVDPNPSNFVCCWILHSQSMGKIGCMMRLEMLAAQQVRSFIMIIILFADTLKKKEILLRYSK